jgi:UDP-glucose 4-epimerase
MLHIADLNGKYLVFNIGPADEGITVRQIAEIVRDHVSPSAAIRYGDGSRGWVGDVPRFFYSIARLRATGWQPQLGSEVAVRRAVQEIADQARATTAS